MVQDNIENTFIENYNKQDMVNVLFFNETYCKIECDYYIADEISERFTFEVPGSRFTPLYKKKLWDGKIRLYKQRDSILYSGLIWELEKFCQERDYHINIDERYKQPLNGDISDFLNGLDIYSNHTKITLRNAQIEAIRHALDNPRSILVSPTASGKSAIIYSITQYLTKHLGLSGLIVVPRVALVNQMFSDFADYSDISEDEMEKFIHTISSGKEKNSDKQITISTWQSLIKLDKSYFEKYDFIIVDECHEAKANSLIHITESCTNARYRIGTTGTLDGKNTNKNVLIGLFGPVKTVTTYQEMIERNEIPDVEIKCVILEHSEYKDWYKKYTSDLKKVGKEPAKKGTQKYKEELNYLISSKNRNLFLRNLALSQEKNTILLVDMVDNHAEVLYDMIKNYKGIGDRKVYLLVGKVNAIKREQYRKEIEKQNNAIIIGTYGVLSTGINIKNIHSIIFASPSSKGRVRNLQSLGRGLRKLDGKEKAVLYDISDDLRLRKNSKSNYTLSHLQERVSIYSAEKLKYKFINITI